MKSDHQRLGEIKAQVDGRIPPICTAGYDRQSEGHVQTWDFTVWISWHSVKWLYQIIMVSMHIRNCSAVFSDLIYLLVNEFTTMRHVEFFQLNTQKHSKPNMLIINQPLNHTTRWPYPKIFRLMSVFLSWLASQERVILDWNSCQKSSYSLLLTPCSWLATHRLTS